MTGENYHTYWRESRKTQYRKIICETETCYLTCVHQPHSLTSLLGATEAHHALVQLDTIFSSY